LVADALARLDRVIGERARAEDSVVRATPSYTRRLVGDRNLRLKKLGEEAAELVVALADADADRAVEEAADLVYHTLVALRSLDRGLDDLRRVLAARDATVG